MNKRNILYLIVILFLFSPISTTKENLHNFYSLNSNDNVTIAKFENATKKSVSHSSNFDQIVYNVFSTDEAFDGYNLFVLKRVLTESENVTNYNTLLITDMMGNILYRKELGICNEISALTVEFINSTTLLLGLPTTAALWNYETNKTTKFNFKGHHEYEYNSLNETFFTFNSYRYAVNDTSYAYEQILEFNRTGDIVWSLSTHSFIPYTQWCPFHDMRDTDPKIAHSNTIFYDVEEDVIYYNSRNVNTFYKINHTNGQVIWALGEYGNFTLFNEYGKKRTNLFYHAHSVEKIGKNTFILFDNGKHNQTDPNNRISRMVEITINETTMTANESWVWRAPEEYFSRHWGDADRLPNGNRLGTFGTVEHGPSGDEIGARLVEVNPDGNIVWEINFPKANNYSYGVYRMERINFQPIIKSLSDINVINTEDVSLEWDVWYNLRNKEPINGSYEIYLNGSAISNGKITYEPFWKLNKINITLTGLEVGLYNLTLIVKDEGGHLEVDSLNITVSTFYLNRIGPQEIEIGANNSIINWSGDTVIPLLVNITVNNSSIFTYEWNGSSCISFNLSILDEGFYILMVQLFNTNNLVYYEEIKITIHPMCPPQISTENETYQYLTWNETLTFFWDIYDLSPTNWETRINGTLYNTGTFSDSINTIIWAVPVLDEGTYNMTLIIHDLLGQNTSMTHWIYVEPPIKPIVINRFENFVFQWGSENVSLKWEIHGGKTWTLRKNGTLFKEGRVTSKILEIKIKSWQNEKWQLGRYNLTLEIQNNEIKEYYINWIEIIFKSGDAFASDILEDKSLWFTNGENSLGPPDGSFSLIYQDYGNGYLTLDMGENEEIINDGGFDFTIFARGGNYSVFVGDTLDSIYTNFVGFSSGNTSFDLQTIDLEIVRFVRIECRSRIIVQLDSIVALYYQQPEIDDSPPVITGPSNFWVWENQTSVELTWSAYDQTPWAYSIYVNDKEVTNSPWDGSTIIYSVNLLETSSEVIITLVLYDLFGNCANFETLIKIKDTTLNETEISEKTTPGFKAFLIFSSFLVLSILSQKRLK